MNSNTRIMMLLQDKVNEGQLKYKQDVPIDGSRDNLKESLDEMLDLCVYLAAALIELHDLYKKEIRDKEYKKEGLPF